MPRRLPAVASQELGTTFITVGGGAEDRPPSEQDTQAIEIRLDLLLGCGALDALRRRSGRLRRRRRIATMLLHAIEHVKDLREVEPPELRLISLSRHNLVYQSIELDVLLNTRTGASQSQRGSVGPPHGASESARGFKAPLVQLAWTAAVAAA